MFAWFCRILYVVLLLTYLPYLPLKHSFKRQEDLSNTYGRGRSRRQFLSAYLVGAPVISGLLTAVLLGLAAQYGEGSAGYIIIAAFMMSLTYILDSMPRVGNGAVYYFSLFTAICVAAALIDSGAL